MREKFEQLSTKKEPGPVVKLLLLLAFVCALVFGCVGSVLSIALPISAANAPEFDVNVVFLLIGVILLLSVSGFVLSKATAYWEGEKQSLKELGQGYISFLRYAAVIVVVLSVSVFAVAKFLNYRKDAGEQAAADRQAELTATYGEAILLCGRYEHEFDSMPTGALTGGETPRQVLLATRQSGEIEIHKWQSKLPAEWQAVDADSTDLIVCIGKPDWTVEDSCRYGLGENVITLERQAVNAYIIDARSQNLVAEERVYGESAGGCPARAAGSGTRRGAAVDHFRLMRVLEEYVGR